MIFALSIYPTLIQLNYSAGYTNRATHVPFYVACVNDTCFARVSLGGNRDSEDKREIDNYKER